MYKLVSTTFILIFLPFVFAWGQSSETMLKNLPVDFREIDNDILTGIDPVNCEVEVKKNIWLNPDSEYYKKLENIQIFWSKDNDFQELESLIPETMNKGAVVQNHFGLGKTWAILTGEIDGEKVAAAKSFEFLETVAPTVRTDLCEADPVVLNIVDFYNRDFFEIDWGDGNKEVVEPVNGKVIIAHPYHDFYKKINVTAFYERSEEKVCISESRTIHRDVPPPVFMTELEGLNDETEVRIRFIGEPDKIYTLEGQRTDQKNWMSLAEAQEGEGQIIGLDPHQEYCFRVKTENDCGEPFYSENTLCSIVIDREVVTNSSMLINWNLPRQPERDPNFMKIEKKEDLYGGIYEHEFRNDPLTVEYLDSDLYCSDTYYYKVSTSYPPVEFEEEEVEVKISTSFIGLKISDAEVDVKPDYFAMTSFMPDNEERIEFMVALRNGDYSLLDSITYFGSNTVNGHFSKIETSRKTKIEVPYNNAIEGQPCFKYQIKDICGITSAVSDPFCVSTIDQVVSDTLNWSPYVSDEEVYMPLETPLYVLEYFDESLDYYVPIDHLQPGENYYISDFIETLTEPVAKFRLVMNQSIYSEDIGDFALNTYSNTYTYFIPPKIYAPTVFTPDGTGPLLSESFGLIPRFIKSGSYTIVDRYGSVVFQSENLEDRWDGIDQNSKKPVSIGMYYYHVNAIDSRDLPFRYSGSVSLLK